MSDIFPDEGLDYLLNLMRKNVTAVPDSFYLFLWGGTGSGTGCPPSTAILSSQTSVTESTYSGYTRVAHTASAWAAPGAGTVWTVSVRRMTGTQQSFPACTGTGAYSSAINGFGIATGSATGATSGPAVFYSNFDDTTPISSLNVGDVVKVTPTWGFSGHAA